MHRTVMSSTEGNGELIADFAAKRTWLHEPMVMRIRGLAAAEEASLLGDEPKVRPTAVTAAFSNREQAFVNTSKIDFRRRRSSVTAA
jgi:hypothetical protein